MLQKPTLLPFGLGVFLGLMPMEAQALMPQQIVQRCQRAYDALHTYQGTATVTTLGNGGRQTYHTSARILFARPGKISASGSTMFGGHFAYVSNGTATRQNMDGSWQSAKDAEMAIAGATGVAQNAATTVPALLLHTQWGDPFGQALKFGPVAGREAVGGVPCYRVTATSPTGTETFWIDSKTFLLKRVVSALSMGAISLHHDERFSGERLNALIPASAFAIPAGG